MLIKKSSDIKESEITPESVYLNRRQILQATAAGAAGAIAGGLTPPGAHQIQMALTGLSVRFTILCSALGAV